MAKHKYQEFYLDTNREQIKELSSLFLAWEKKTEDKYLIEEILRLTHSMKGSAATMGYRTTANLLHAIEDVFYAILQKNLIITDKIFNALLNSISILNENLKSIADKGKEKPLANSVNNLKKILNNNSVKPSKKDKIQTDSLRETNHSQTIFYTPLDIVIPTIKLDKIQNNIDALVMNHMQIKNSRQTDDHNKMLAICMQSDKIINDLRRDITELRMLPLHQIFTPLPRLVRELAKAEKKKVDFIVEDNNFSLDKAIIDDLMDVIIQLLTNAVVHGISQTQTDGQIILQTEIDKDQVKITIADNGQGIDWQHVLDLALKRKVITQQMSKSMTVKDVKDLIFQSGLSSSKRVNVRSGRGVGLSLVKQRVDALKGKIVLDSGKNRGTKFIIYLPLPVSIFRCLIFKLNKFILALPLSHVEKVIRLKQPADFNKQKTFIYQKKKYDLLTLAKNLNLPRWSLTTDSLAILQYNNKVKLLPLPTNIREEEVVIKRTPKILQHNKVVSGVAIAADGQPVLLLDMHNLMS